MRKTIATFLAGFVLLSYLTANEDDYLKPLGKPPKAKPQRRQAGEALPPLPLPVTPLRRSEKKKPPSPPILMGKVIWGDHLDYKWSNGFVSRVYDWNMVPAECQQLLRLAKSQLNVEYKHQTVHLENFSSTPAEVPILYFSGGRSIKLKPAERVILRNYMLSGGMIWFDSVVGSPYFYKSSVRELSTIMPEMPIKRLPIDHPIYHMVKDTVKLKIKGNKDVIPPLDGLYVGNRLAAVISPYGLGVGWDNADTSLIPKASYYDRLSSMQLGLNLISYAISWFRIGQSHARSDIYSSQDAGNDPDSLSFAQIRTHDVWNTEPGSAVKLLRFMNKNLSVNLSKLEKTVKPSKDPLENYMFLYLSGICDFRLSENERAAIRDYIKNGGFLFINNSLGMSEFNKAAQRELKALYPDHKLELIRPDHALFQNGPYPISSCSFSAVVKTKYPGLSKPMFLGIKIDDDYRVIYSPIDLAAGWQGEVHPLSYTYSENDALKLGADLLTYFMTH